MEDHPQLKWRVLLAIAFVSLLMPIMTMAHGPHQSKNTFIRPRSVEEILTDDQIDRIEFQYFCKYKQEEKLRTTKKEQFLDGQHKERCKVPDAGDFDPEIDLLILFSLFMIILLGVFVRTGLRYFRSSLPYTVVLMVCGMLIGSISKQFCTQTHAYTAIARINPKIILFTFLPALIFESAFSISVHTFMRSATQILLTALPGMVFSTFVTALVCWQFFDAYRWTFVESLFFGSIISATDPVAVVSILRELGVADSLSVMIEGESLLNDGVAILLFQIFESILVPSSEATEDTGNSVLIMTKDIVLKFCQIAIGGPVFGYVMGKLAIVSLSMVFNDATVEITVTLVAAYLTYFIGEDMLGVSGVMAVVILGITMSAERTTISPDSEVAVHHFWEMVGYLANTVLFVMTGIVIAETALSDSNLEDLGYAFFLWFALNIIRFLMLLLLSPLLSRVGYGMSWQNMVIMMWGGLRGAVGICLSLEVYENVEFCHQSNIGPKFLLQTAGIVFLTLVINGTTTKRLLEVLKLTEISSGRIEEMAHACKIVSTTQKRSMSMLKHDRFLADACWKEVERFTMIVDPYRKLAESRNKPAEVCSLTILHEYEDRTTVCQECHNVVRNEPSSLEYEELMEEARLRILNALKVSFWRQFEQGILSESAVQILSSAAEQAEDAGVHLLHAIDLEKYTVISGFLSKFRKFFIKKFGFDEEEPIPEKPKWKCLHAFWWMATSSWFDAAMMLIVFINLIPVLIEVTDSSSRNKEQALCEIPFFTGMNVAFTILYSLEFLVKLIGRGCKDYCTNKWNYLDMFVLVVAIIDIAFDMLTYTNACFANQTGFKDPKEKARFLEYLKLVKSIRLVRLVRSLRLVKPIFPLIISMVNRRINNQLFIGYEIGKGFLIAIEDVLKFVPQMVENTKVSSKLKDSLDKQRKITVKLLKLLQRDHPGTAIAVKTRHGSRVVLNKMRDALNELKDDGLVDDKENVTLTLMLEERLKRLWSSPIYIPPHRQSCQDDEFGSQEMAAPQEEV